MLTLLLALCILGFIISVKLAIKYPKNQYGDFSAHDAFLIISWVLGIAILCLSIAVACLATQVATKDSIDEKIAYYEQENQILEDELKNVVAIYIAREPEKYKDIPEDFNAVALAKYFEKLDENASLEEQTAIKDTCMNDILYEYKQNESNISSLKERKVNIPRKAWLVYFSTNK